MKRKEVSFHWGVEVRWVAFGWRLVLTACASESRRANVSVWTVHGGPEAGRVAFEWRVGAHPLRKRDSRRRHQSEATSSGR